jgi:ribosomal protein L11 methyltransferase
MAWWDIYVQVSEGMIDAVSACLQRLGSSGVVIHEETILSPDGALQAARRSGEAVLYGAFRQDDVLATQICALQQFLASCVLHGESSAAWKLYCRPLHAHDYLTQWRRFFRPLSIGSRLVIYPPWETMPLPPEAVGLVLDPGQAFGTGLHPTTHMCLTHLVQRVSRSQTGPVLDVGCGSGVLSLAALQLGAESAVGVDIDAQAIEVAARNARLNGLQERVQFRHGSVETVTGQFAVLTANIYLGPLVDMMEAFVQRLTPQGVVILSGILAHQELALQAAMQAAGLALQQRLEETGWVALVGQRRRIPSETD